MRIKGIVWLGTRTAHYSEMREFVARITGLEPWLDEPGFAVFDLASGDRIEVMSQDSDAPPYDAPTAGFLVDDVSAARAELEAEGIEFIGPIGRADDGNSWSHFRAPDGSVYELTAQPGHPSHET